MDGQIQNDVNPYAGLSQEALDKLLFQAIKYGEGSLAVELLLNNGANKDACENGQTALMIAIHFDQLDMVNLLIKKGVNIEAIDEDGSTALMCAIFAGNLRMVDLLIKQGADVEAVDNEGLTALKIAAPRSRSITFRLLCDMSPEQRQVFVMNSPDNLENYPFWSMPPGPGQVFSIPIRENHYTLVAKFNQALKDNANKLYNIIMPTWNLYASSMFNEFPAEVLQYIQNFEIILQKFPDWYQHRIKADLDRTLDFVSKNKKEHPINYFVSQAVFIQKALDEQLLVAINNQDFETVELSIKKGANVNATHNGFTMLRDAICYNRRTTVKMVDLLIKKGANINAIDTLGMTALMYAISAGLTSTAFRLLDEMTFEQHQSFAMSSLKNNRLLTQYYNALFSWNNHVNNMLCQYPAELLIQSVHTFPDWYQHRILAMSDVKPLNYFSSENITAVPVIFSKKRKPDSELEDNQSNKKEKIGVKIA